MLMGFFYCEISHVLKNQMYSTLRWLHYIDLTENEHESSASLHAIVTLRY